MNTKGVYLGELEELVLLSVATLADDVYGVTVKRYIFQETGRNVNISAIHEVLKRLQRKGYLTSRIGGATKTRGGRRKRLFELTAAGRNKLEQVIMMKMQMYKQVPNISIKLT